MKVILHAPTPGALARARIDARDLLREGVNGIVRVMASHDAAPAALDDPDPDIDPLTVLCLDSLARAGREPPRGAECTPNGAALVARLARKGWACVRA